MSGQEVKVDGRRALKVPCPGCGSKESTTLFHKNGFGYVRCTGCAVVRVDPQLEPEEVVRIYGEGFGAKESSKPEPVDDSSFKPVLELLEARDGVGSLLDVGCFTGHFLAAARRRGWQVSGTEICEEAARRAEERGVRVHRGSLDELDISNASIDAATLFDVIEHLRDPLRDMRRLHRILRPGATLYVETPNFDALARRLRGSRWCVFFPWHFFYFTASTLRTLLETAGFEVLHVHSEGVGPLGTNDPCSALGGSPARRRIPLWKRLALRHRRLLKPPYRLLRRTAQIPIRAVDAAGLHLGSKLVAVARRSPWEGDRAVESEHLLVPTRPPRAERGARTTAGVRG